MLHHFSLAVTDLERAAKFYDAVLSPLGYVRVWTHKTAVGYGSAGGGDNFAIKLRPERVVVPGEGFHVAFSAPSRRRWAHFTRRRWSTAVRTMARRDCTWNTARIILRRLCLIRTGTGLRR